MTVPRWSSLARSGEPSPGALWPFDPELAQLELGRRRLIKRETRGGEELDVAVAWLERHSLSVLTLGSVALATAEPRLLDRAAELERAGDRDAGAVRELGGWLGYPRCCVERYLSLAIRDDAALFEALLPVRPAPAPPESLWLVGPLALIGHAPCSLDCAETLELGRATLDRLEQRHPGFALRWRSLARRLHQIDDAGRVFSSGPDVLEIAVARVPQPVPARAPQSVRFSADHRG